MADTASTTDNATGTTDGTDSAGTTATTTATTATDTAATASGDGTDWKAQTEKWRALARKHENAAKDNAAAAQKLAELEESQKTDQQKLADRLAATEKERDEYRIRDIRATAARDAGLDADLVQFLTATDAETALAQAKALAKRLAPAKPDLRQGARTPAKAPDDMNAWLRHAAGYNRTP
jgi:hypothetical protein